MKIKAANKILLVLLLIGVLKSMSNVQTVKETSRTWIVDDDGPGDFTRIQDAVNAAGLGDTIYVHNGTYYERVVVNKDCLTLTGESTKATIDGMQGGVPLTLAANNINVSQFAICNGSKTSFMSSGVQFGQVRGCTVRDNVITDCGTGLFLHYSHNNSLHGNIISNNKYAGIILVYSNDNIIERNVVSANGHLGIHLDYYCYRNVIKDNVAFNNLFGVELERSSNNVILNNTVFDNDVGIFFYNLFNERSGGYNTLEFNNMTDNRYNFGVWSHFIEGFIQHVDASNKVNGKCVYYLINQDNIIVEPNTFPNVGYLAFINSKNVTAKNLNITTNANGVLFAYSTDFLIINNSLSDNHEGIALLNCNSGEISLNRISNNEFGVWTYYSNENKLFHNNLENNLNQVVSNASLNLWNDCYPSGGNYWSDHNGTDLFGGPYQNVTGSDGIGDSSYVIDKNNADRYPLMNPWSPTPIVSATVDVDPDSLNLKSRGKWITMYIELPGGYNVGDIDISSIRLNSTVPAELNPVAIGDYDRDTILDLMIKFDRQDVIAILRVGRVALTITGKVKGTPFEGKGRIKVIDKHTALLKFLPL